MTKLVIDATDPDSIHSGIQYLEVEKKRIKQFTDRLLERIAYEACVAAKAVFGPSVDVSATKIDNGYSIIARGDRVCFLEFGTGIYAWDSSALNPFAHSPELPFVVEAGSWSMTEGAGTWQEVIDGKVSPEEWRYNRRARPGMYEAYKAIVEHLTEWAREEYK